MGLSKSLIKKWLNQLENSFVNPIQLLIINPVVISILF